MHFRQPIPGKSDVGGVPGDALDNPEQDEEDGQLHQERQTSTQRIDAVLLVEAINSSFIFWRSSLYRV